MANTAYLHALSVTVSGDVDPRALHTEIAAVYAGGEPLENAPSFLGLNYNTPKVGKVELWFADPLNGPEEATVTALVTAHAGTHPAMF